MSDQGHRRASGASVAVVLADEAAEDFGKPVEVETEVEEARRWRSPGFQRLRTDWRTEDRPIIEGARETAEGRLRREFGGLYILLNRIYDVVREPAVTPDGEIIKDRFGYTQWLKDENDHYRDDFSKLTLREKEHFLFELTTNLIWWQQQAADAWGEAMLAKTMWTERFSFGFDAPTKGTDEQRKAAANLDARDEHYFAIFLAWYSKKADALVRSVELLGQRIKDSMV
jgi:hypothetical protein